MSVTIGTDPELFLRDSRTGGVVPVCGLIGGAKGRPLDLGDGYGVQEDNVMLEFNTPPAEHEHAFIETVRTGVSRCLEVVKKAGEHLGFDDRSERLFGFDLLSDPKAQEFGCSPDYDAYKQGAGIPALRGNELDEDEGAWRFAGGHVHLGYRPSFQMPNFVAASFADVFLGLPSVGLDKQPRRRKLYGQPGRFRPTKYGIEYRVLSNFWVCDTGLIEEVAYRAFALGLFLENCKEGRMQHLFKEIPWGDVCRAINDESEERAADILTYIRHDLDVPEVEAA